MTQDEINQAEWNNPDNWGGPDWIAVYFSKKDTRSWVPKRIPWMGYTLNLGQTSGVRWFVGLIGGTFIFLSLLWLGILVSILHVGKDATHPRVVTTFPLNGSRDVDPSLTEVSVTFNEEMKNNSWSWAYSDKSKFPRMTGQPYYTDNNTRNVLPVKLEPNREYEVWINLDKYLNFKDKHGNSSVPFRFSFRTRESP